MLGVIDRRRRGGSARGRRGRRTGGRRRGGRPARRGRREGSRRKPPCASPAPARDAGPRAGPGRATGPGSSDRWHAPTSAEATLCWAQHFASAAASRLTTIVRPGPSSCRSAGSGSSSAATPCATGDHAEDLAALVEQVGSIEVAECLEVAARRRLALGDRHEQVVAEELTERPVRPAGLLDAATRQAGGRSPGRGG